MCRYAISGCGYPQGECSGLCLHRVDTSALKRGQIVAVAGEVEQRRPDVHTEELSGIRFAFSVYRLYRAAGQPITTSIRHAWRAVRGAK